MVSHGNSIINNSLLPPAGLEVSKQRLLSAQLPFLPPTITESEKIPYLSSCIPLNSVLMVSMFSAGEIALQDK